MRRRLARRRAASALAASESASMRNHRPEQIEIRGTAPTHGRAVPVSCRTLHRESWQRAYQLGSKISIRYRKKCNRVASYVHLCESRRSHPLTGHGCESYQAQARDARGFCHSLLARTQREDRSTARKAGLIASTLNSPKVEVFVSGFLSPHATLGSETRRKSGQSRRAPLR
jgi:hypothetical protein